MRYGKSGVRHMGEMGGWAKHKFLEAHKHAEGHHPVEKDARRREGRRHVSEPPERRLRGHVAVVLDGVVVRPTPVHGQDVDDRDVDRSPVLLLEHPRKRFGGCTVPTPRILQGRKGGRVDMEGDGGRVTSGGGMAGKWGAERQGTT